MKAILIRLQTLHIHTTECRSEPTSNKDSRIKRVKLEISYFRTAHDGGDLDGQSTSLTHWEDANAATRTRKGNREEDTVDLQRKRIINNII